MLAPCGHMPMPMPNRTVAKCQHDTIYIDVSPHACEAGFSRPVAGKRAAAQTASGRIPKKLDLGKDDASYAEGMRFPGPLVLPDDDLSIDPKWPPQTFRSFSMTEYRNKITKKRNTIYVIAAPRITAEVEVMKDWQNHNVPAGYEIPSRMKLHPPSAEEVREYLAAFYHTMPVKMFPETFRWVSWNDKPSLSPQHVGLAVGDNCIRVGSRPSFDDIARRQLNLNDILDLVLEIVPADAYAVTLMLDHDIYEEEEDGYCGGRAFGSSRISCLSSFRYHPCLDDYCGIDYEHMWPASHCRKYVDRVAGKKGKKRKGAGDETTVRRGNSREPIALGIQQSAENNIPRSDKELEGLWLTRVARATAHEVGHCVGMDHCVFYACSMQGSAGMCEDDRQPLYLCPVCLSKLSFAVVGERLGREKEAAYVKERYEALKKYCELHSSVGIFSAYSAWLEAEIQTCA
jgi:archaemetzincin